MQESYSFGLLVVGECLESFEQFHVVHLEHFVKLEQVFEKNEDEVAEQTGLPAERTRFQLVQDLADHSHEVLLVVQNT